MKAEVRYVEDRDTYELGAKIEGGFVPFTTMPGPQVRSIAESAKNAEGEQPESEQ